MRVGQKGNISTINDYWDVATLFEVRVISEDYAGAVQAVERMYLLDPPDWYVSLNQIFHLKYIFIMFATFIQRNNLENAQEKLLFQ